MTGVMSIRGEQGQSMARVVGALPDPRADAVERCAQRRQKAGTSPVVPPGPGRRDPRGAIPGEFLPGRAASFPPGLPAGRKRARFSERRAPTRTGRRTA